MKRVLGIIFALLFVLGFATSASAALTFDVDFWSTSNTVHNYAQSGPGDLGATFLLDPGEIINVDIYFSTDLLIDVAASWDLQYNPAFATVTNFTAPGAPWAGPLVDDTPGSFKFQAIVFPGSVVTGDDNLFGTVQFQCTGAGNVSLDLFDYLGFLTIDSTTHIVPPVHLGTLQQTPIPGAVLLLGTGLAGLVGLRRIRRR